MKRATTLERGDLVSRHAFIIARLQEEAQK